jgi:hypothetical protein
LRTEREHASAGIFSGFTQHNPSTKQVRRAVSLLKTRPYDHG